MFPISHVMFWRKLAAEMWFLAMADLLTAVGHEQVPHFLDAMVLKEKTKWVR